ncbi:MAG: hypothetical protein ACOC9P_00245 [bacterium]
MSKLMLSLLTVALGLLIGTPSFAQDFASHTPQRPLPTPNNDRPPGEGPTYYLHPTEGDDANDGSQEQPWRSINHAFTRLSPGDTLVLRGGTYFENVYCAVTGTKDKPITIRSAPGELAIIDAGLPLFQTNPAEAWEPVEDGVEGEYVSTRRYKNIRDVVGRFGDSLVGLQTYWYRMDLQAENEKWIPNEETFIEPMYCGPGLHYDKETGRIHARLAHTSLELPDSVDHEIDHYKGETDPRKLPLIVAPFSAKALHVDQAEHVRFQDLVFRGGGYKTVDLEFGVDLTFDGCTIYAGGYGVWSKNTGPMEMVDCGVFGMMAPWMFRTENVMYAYSPRIYPPFIDGIASTEIQGDKEPLRSRVVRHISRLPTHAVLVTAGGYEFETFYYPLNHDWNIHHSEFTDGHDGVYVSGRNIRFHHNLVDNMQDDAVYISSPTPYITDELYVYQNLIRQCVGGFGAHARGGPGGKIYLFRNVVDMRKKVQFARPTPKRPEGRVDTGNTGWLVHNSDNIIHMEDIYFYHNDFIVPMSHSWGGYTAGAAASFAPDSERRVFNNIIAFVGGHERYPVSFGWQRDAANLAIDGNLHWHSNPDVEAPTTEQMYKNSRNHPLSEANREIYPPGWDANSVVGDPKFVAFYRDPGKPSDLRLQEGSPAINAGVKIPENWPDPLRDDDAGAPDIGAMPKGVEPLRVGVNGRTTAGE